MPSWFIGNENVSDANEPYKEEQIRSNVDLCAEIAHRHMTINRKLIIALLKLSK